MKKSTFTHMDHRHVMAAGKTATLTTFTRIVAVKGLREAKILAHIGSTGSRLNALPTATSGCRLNAQEWRDAFYLRYACTKHDFSSTCDGCGADFSIAHALT